MIIFKKYLEMVTWGAFGEFIWIDPIWYMYEYRYKVWLLFIFTKAVIHVKISKSKWNRSTKLLKDLAAFELSIALKGVSHIAGSDAGASRSNILLPPVGSGIKELLNVNKK